MANHDQTLVSVEEIESELPLWSQEETERHAVAPLLRICPVREGEVSDINVHIGRNLPDERRNELFDGLVGLLRRVLGITEPKPVRREVFISHRFGDAIPIRMMGRRCR